MGSTFRRAALAMALAASYLAFAGSGRAAALTPEQRAEAVRAVRQALHDDPSILRDALAVLQADDARRQDAATGAALAAQRGALTANAADPVAGDPAGDVTVVEFYDPRCPYCRQMLPVLAALLQADPHVRLVYKDMPILGPASVIESRALLAAHRQGGYTRLQAALMRTNAVETPASLRAEAERQGLDGARFERDLADPALQAQLDGNLRLAAALHIDGTPALVVGQTMISGAVDLQGLQSAIASARRSG